MSLSFSDRHISRSIRTHPRFEQLSRLVDLDSAPLDWLRGLTLRTLKLSLPRWIWPALLVDNSAFFLELYVCSLGIDQGLSWARSGSFGGLSRRFCGAYGWPPEITSWKWLRHYGLSPVLIRLFFHSVLVVRKRHFFYANSLWWPHCGNCVVGICADVLRRSEFLDERPGCMPFLMLFDH